LISQEIVRDDHAMGFRGAFADPLDAEFPVALTSFAMKRRPVS